MYIHYLVISLIFLKGVQFPHFVWSFMFLLQCHLYPILEFKVSVCPFPHFIQNNLLCDILIPRSVQLWWWEFFGMFIISGGNLPTWSLLLFSVVWFLETLLFVVLPVCCHNLIITIIVLRYFCAFGILGYTFYCDTKL